MKGDPPLAQLGGNLFEIAERTLRLLREVPGKIRSFFADLRLSYIHRAYAR